ncbi:MAG TPA: hypothetical protein VJ255_09550, partial [Candidatus Acidoferrum sp.]|nr:hypothetical protein [Candidatus Acidoferrum sp.]
RVMRELRVSEVRLACAGGNDQTPVLNLTPETERVHNNTPAFEVDINDLAKYNIRVLLISEDIADRRRDVTLGENSRRDLVQQRLEQMMIGAVDNGHVDIGVAE